MVNINLDWNQYLSKSTEVVSEGVVLLKNENNVLPINMDEEVSVFGRMQLHYYKSGTGSGGMVNVTKVTGILDGLLDSGVKINTELLDVYKKWEEENPFDVGKGWGGEPWSQKEMEISDEVVDKASSRSSVAIVIIARTAGEEQDNTLEKGAYYLSDTELDMLTKVRKKFEKVIVLLNTGGIMDMSFIESCTPDAVMYVWQGGMTGGTGVANVLTGKINPSGKLPDTIAYNISDYSSDENFGSRERNIYADDIYVGYRYFETFAHDKVRYPFGFGLSYTTFEFSVDNIYREEDKWYFNITVKNTGNVAGKETIQIYCSSPQGLLGKPSRSLCGYEKTPLLKPGESSVVKICVDISDIASFDDNGATGNQSCFVVEKGEYTFYIGTDVRSAVKSHTFTFDNDVVVEKLSAALAPVMEFERIRPADDGNGKYTVVKEKVSAYGYDEKKRRLENIPKEIEYTGDKGFKLRDVADGKCTMEQFIAQLSDYDLSCIIRGEGMGSPKVTPGTASAFGGVTKDLLSYGIPCGCCADGPSGMRLDCGTKAFSLPNGTLIASTFNKTLVRELYSFLGLEMRVNKVDCLLGPGMNIHRHMLNGRNFEYFSEDPFLTGTMAAAEITGLKESGSSGTLKHFCGNNQETGRHTSDSVISQRALREIYLKGFEIAVKRGKANSIMTTYGSVNGLWTAGNYDLNTVVLRNEWGFDGFVMTDWWADINERGKKPDKVNFSAMASAQNDVYMVCSDGAKNDDNTLKSLTSCELTRGELQRNAMNICRFLMGTSAMKRLCGTEENVTIINSPDVQSSDENPVVFYEIDDVLELPLQDISTEKETSYCFALTVNKPGWFNVTVTASSELGELAQIPVTFYSMGTAHAVFTWNGTGGKDVSYQKEIPIYSRFSNIRLYFAQSGLDMKSIKFERVEKQIDWENL
ncbi:MAG: glycoside hydrolase family 3 protein [Oscillospiraceae bacterium]|nr:glycoside hydrolase family 3 protein [Oscillospiraceae bacterium]